MQNNHRLYVQYFYINYVCYIVFTRNGRKKYFFVIIILYKSRLKSLSLNMKMALLIKTILVLQSYMFCNLSLKIVLDAPLLFESHLCQSMSMFRFENLCPRSLILSLRNRKKSLKIRSDEYGG